MANINGHFLQIIKEEKLNVFVNSLLHLESVIRAGFQSGEIIFTASALSRKMMKTIEKYGVQLNVDSPGQLQQWMELFPDKKVGIQCNIGDKIKTYSNRAGAFIGKKSRLGFTLQEIEEIQDKTKVAGLHLYAGTDIFDIDYFISCYKELLYISKGFHHLDYLNLGGGFGVSESGEERFNIEKYNERITELLEDFSQSQDKNIKLVLDPGRIIGGEAGYFVCYVTDIKKTKGKTVGWSECFHCAVSPSFALYRNCQSSRCC